MLLYSRQRSLAWRTTVSEHRPKSLIYGSHGASHPQLAQSPHLKRSQRDSDVVGASMPKSPQGAVEKAASRARTKLFLCDRTANKD